MHITQLHVEISEMTSRIEILEMQNFKLKEDNKKLTKHFGQKKAQDFITESTKYNWIAKCVWFKVYV